MDLIDNLFLYLPKKSNRSEKEQGNVNRVQTDPGKPGKPGKMINFEKNQGNLGKPREKLFFSTNNQRNSGNFFLKRYSN